MTYVVLEQVRREREGGREGEGGRQREKGREGERPSVFLCR